MNTQKERLDLIDKVWSTWVTPYKGIVTAFMTNMIRTQNLHDEISRLMGNIDFDIDDEVEIRRKFVVSSEMYRAIVILTHASLESLIRETWRIYLKSQIEAPGTWIDKLSLHTGRGQVKFGWKDLYGYSNKTVRELIELSIDQYVDEYSFNGIASIIDAMNSIGMNESVLNPNKDDIIELLSRRHEIVHRADIDYSATPYLAKHIWADEVVKWTSSALRFGQSFIRSLASTKNSLSVMNAELKRLGVTNWSITPNDVAAALERMDAKQPPNPVEH